MLAKSSAAPQGHDMNVDLVRGGNGLTRNYVIVTNVDERRIARPFARLACGIYAMFC